VRELNNVVKAAAVLAGAEPIGLTHLPARVLAVPSDTGLSDESPASSFGNASHDVPESASGGTAPSPGRLREDRKRLEREHIDAALRATGGDRSKAAEMLGISRKTLNRKRRGRR
jgi:DNA-binding NtrC family response regulator